MHFVFIKVIDIEYKDDIFLGLESVGISKASYTEAYNLDHVLSKELPLFKGFFKSEEDQVNLMSRCLISTRPTHKEIIKNIRLEEQKLKIEHNIMSWFMHYGQKCNCFYCRKELRDKIEWISWR